MGIITTIFLYGWPYVLASFIGFLVAGTWNKRSNQSRQNTDKSNKLMLQERSYMRGNDELQQTNLESCDPTDDTPDSEDITLNGDIDDDDSAFNFDEGEHVPFERKFDYTEEEMLQKSRQFYEEMNDRRSVRVFSNRPVPLRVIENIIRTAGTGPSGAHTEPWTFSVVRDQATKEQIREIIEAEEKVNYEKRMGNKWLNDLKAIGTTYKKPYLSVCSTLIVIFKQVYSFDERGQRKTHYYHEISTAISVGLMLAAIQKAGLVTCTTTPMNAGPRLRKILGRESYEKVLLLLPVGYASENATVPDFKRKSLEDIMDLHD